jgi:peptidoglycan-associated lipoprotein
MNKWIIAAMVAAALVVAGCKSTDTQEAAPVEEGQAPVAANAGGATTSGLNSGGVTGTAKPGTGVGEAKLPPATGIYVKRVVLFDFDSFAVKDEYRPVVEAHAKFLAANKGARVTLQGHADERGSREYNIALGQKRADAVKQLMQLLGASEGQIETVSFGKEKPRSDGHDESAWAQNRRVEILYVGE